MELLQLQYFRAIATYGSMSRAAQMLFVSQPTLSVTMTRLEESLGFSLFVRQKGKLSLTPAGLQFLECTERILSDLDNTIDAIRSSTCRQSDSTIRIVSCLNDLLGRVMADHYDDLRHVHIQEQYCDNDQIPKAINDRQADWGIVHGPSHALHLHHTLLHQCPRVFVMRDGHPLLRYEKLPASVLPDQVYLCNRARDEKDVLAYCGKKYRFIPQIESECDDCILEMHILNSTDCISTMPLLTYVKLLRTNPSRPLRYLFPDFDIPAVQTYLVRLHEHPLNACSARLAEYIKAFLDEENVKLDQFLESGVVEP